MSSLLKALSDRCYAVSINSVSVRSPSFADDISLLALYPSDDISLLALYPSILETFMNICHKYGITWNNEINHTKSGVYAFGETKPIHSQSMKEREWMLGDTVIDELYE